jgi:DNA-binding protein H-NS
VYACCFGLDDIKKWDYSYYSKYAENSSFVIKNSIFDCRYLSCYKYFNNRKSKRNKNETKSNIINTKTDNNNIIEIENDNDKLSNQSLAEDQQQQQQNQSQNNKLLKISFETTNDMMKINETNCTNRIQNINNNKTILKKSSNELEYVEHLKRKNSQPIEEEHHVNEEMELLKEEEEEEGEEEGQEQEQELFPEKTDITTLGCNLGKLRDTSSFSFIDNETSSEIRSSFNSNIYKKSNSKDSQINRTDSDLSYHKYNINFIQNNSEEKDFQSKNDSQNDNYYPHNRNNSKDIMSPLLKKNSSKDSLNSNNNNNNNSNHDQISNKFNLFNRSNTNSSKNSSKNNSPNRKLKKNKDENTSVQKYDKNGNVIMCRI